jgi:hypothetical protein
MNVPGFSVASDGALTVALDITLTDERSCRRASPGSW